MKSHLEAPATIEKVESLTVLLSPFCWPLLLSHISRVTHTTAAAAAIPLCHLALAAVSAHVALKLMNVD